MSYTKDGETAYTGMKVYGISPWADIETLYIGFDLEKATTNTPSKESGAAMCWFETSRCYASEDVARSVACTYVEDDEGFMHPPIPGDTNGV